MQEQKTNIEIDDVDGSFSQLKYEETLANYEKAIELNPKNTSAYLNKGSFLMSIGRRDEGLDAYHKALAIDLAKTHACH